MKLYNSNFAPNPLRVRIFLAEKGLSIPRVEVDLAKLEHKTEEFSALNPFQTIPVLELDDGTMISESIAICRCVEELHPAPNLFGATPLRARPRDRRQVESSAAAGRRRVHSSRRHSVADAYASAPPAAAGVRIIAVAVDRSGEAIDGRSDIDAAHRMAAAVGPARPSGAAAISDGRDARRPVAERRERHRAGRSRRETQ
ncbi:MAG: glutathione S-transferase N-terminal domain-containing protein [Hyphomicrobiales bacterium]|nr:glutathione S-transferase N-terminal domain-containing protein [Hyphomicrobiales bacterium]